MFSIGQAKNLTVSVRPANNFPLDVYFLMDQSFSMNDDLQNLKTLASQLGTYIRSYKHIYNILYVYIKLYLNPTMIRENNFVITQVQGRGKDKR